jgi:hypothetical protein
MSIHRDHPPMNSIAARRQGHQANAHCVPIDPRLSFIDARAAGVSYVDRAKRGFQSIRKCQRDLAWGLQNYTTGLWTSVVKRGVSKRYA